MTSLKRKGFVILDLDNTLFDTKKLKKDMFRALSEFGIDLSIIERTYRQGKFNLNYDIDRFLRILRRYRKFSLRAGRSKILQILQDSKSYVFPSVFSSLKKLRTKGYKLILLSRGNSFFNSEKIRISGLRTFFDETYISPKTKTLVLKKIFKSVSQDNVWHFNDSIEECEKIRHVFPRIKQVLKVEKGRVNKGKGLRTAVSMKDFLSYL